MEIGRSKFTIGILAGFLMGIFLARWLNFGLSLCGAIIIVLIVFLIYFWSRIFYRWVLFCTLGLFLGFGYYFVYSNWQNSHVLIYDQEIHIEGAVSAPPQIKPTKVQAILAYQGTKILVELPRYPEVKYNDVLAFDGQIQDPKSIKTIDNFNYGEYLLNKNIRGVVKNPERLTILALPKCEWWECLDKKFLKVVYGVGESFQESLAKVLPEPYASFQAGLILGNRTTQIPDSLTTAFNRTGTTHIVAVSGYNVTIIISVLAIIFAVFGRRFSFWMTLFCILVFVVMTGGSASVARAGILGGLAAWGHLEGRRVNHLLLLLVVASVMILFNPYQLVGDISFQLSFLAFAGLIYVSPLLANFKILGFIPETPKAILSETLGAQIAVLPVIIYNFGIISIVAPVVNILVLPFVPLSMLLGFLAGLGGMVWDLLGRVLADIAWVLLKYIIVVVESFSKISWAAVVYKTTDWWWIVIYYVITVVLIVRFKQRQSANLEK